MVKGLPIKIKRKLPITKLSSKHKKSVPLHVVVDNEDAQILKIDDFDKELQDCVKLDEELGRYFTFLNGLSRDELLAIVKYEVYHRVLMQQDLDMITEDLEKTDE